MCGGRVAIRWGDVRDVRGKAKRKKRCVRSGEGWLRAERSEMGFAVSSKPHLSDKSFTTEDAEGNGKNRKMPDAKTRNTCPIGRFCRPLV